MKYFYIILFTWLSTADNILGIFDVKSTFYIHRNRTVAISLVIPTIVTEINCMQQFLKSLERSTFYPSESIIIASGSGDNLSNSVLQLKNLVKAALVPNLKLILLSGIKLQSTSRNIGANYSTQPYISFFDGDDYLHPQRFEMLNKALEGNPSIDLLLHMWKKFSMLNYDRIIFQNMTSIDIALTPEIIYDAYINKTIVKQKHNPYRVRYLIWLFPEYFNIANGHNTMRRKVWESIPQISHPGAEDSIHNMNIIEKKFNVMVIHNVLMYYRVRKNGVKTC